MQILLYEGTRVGSFAADTESQEDGGKLRATLSRDWDIWGPNGGYIASIALRAAGKMAPPDHRPATFSCQYLSAGQFADVQIDVEPVRKGRNAWCQTVVLTQSGKRILQAQVWTTNKSEGPTKFDREMPRVPHHGTLKTWREINPGAPPHTFWTHFDSKPAKPIPWERFDERGSVMEEWYRFRDFPPTDDLWLDNARALLLIDTIQWPSWTRGLEVKPDYVAPSLDVTVWFHQRPGKAEWLLGRARGRRIGRPDPRQRAYLERRWPPDRFRRQQYAARGALTWAGRALKRPAPVPRWRNW